jgi:cytochrome P450
MHYFIIIPLVVLIILCIYLELRARKVYRQFIDVRTGNPIPVAGGYWRSIIFLVRASYDIVFAEAHKKRGLDYGPVYASYMFEPSICFCDPDDVKSVLKRMDDFPKDIGVFKNNFDHAKQILGPANIAAVNNPQWHGERSLLNKAFLTTSVFFEPMCKKINTCLTKWENQQHQVCVGKDLQKMALDVLACCILGCEFDTLNGKFSEPLDAYNHSLEFVFNPARFIFTFINKLPLKSNESMHKYLNTWAKYCNQIMEDTKKKMEDKKNQVDVEETSNERKAVSLIELMYENNLSDETIRDNISAFFLAGHDTTTSSLGWLVSILASHPDVQQKARQEILEKFPGEVTFDSLKELKYIDGLIKEGLRFYPPAPNISVRKSAVDTVVGNVRIPAGTSIEMNVISIAHNPKIWGDPENIRPERWYSENITKEQRNAWMPFSVGPRICIGMNMSLLEQKIFLVYFLKRFQQVKLAPSGKVTGNIGGFTLNYGPDMDKLILDLEKTNYGDVMEGKIE